MKKTNILVEVDDHVYDIVVAPHKKNKTFSKLMATLLKGYIENDYVHAYAEGTLEEMHKASVDALDNVIEGMQQSLANMGLYTSELKSTTDMGKDLFEEKVVESKENLEKYNSEEVEELKGTVDELKEQNSLIISMLKDLMSGNASVKEVKKVVEDTSSVIKEQVSTKSSTLRYEDEVEKPLPKQSMKVPIEIEDEDDEEDSVLDANAMMQNLLQGNSFSF